MMSVRTVIVQISGLGMPSTLSNDGSIAFPTPVAKDKLCWTRALCQTQWVGRKGTRTTSRGLAHTGSGETHTGNIKKGTKGFLEPAGGLKVGF